MRWGEGNLQGGCTGLVSPSSLEAWNTNNTLFSMPPHRRETATLLSPASLCSHLKQPALDYTHQGMSDTHSETHVCVCMGGRCDGRDPTHPSDKCTSRLFMDTLTPKWIHLLHDGRRFRSKFNVTENLTLYLILHKKTQTLLTSQSPTGTAWKTNCNKLLLQKWCFNSSGDYWDWTFSE